MPLAAFLQVPREIRLCRGETTEIHLSTCYARSRVKQWAPQWSFTTWQVFFLRGCLWVQFIDNVASHAALMNGSSSVLSGHIIAGATWEPIAKQRIFQWFDRVDTKSDHVDGLSRGRIVGVQDNPAAQMSERPCSVWSCRWHALRRPPLSFSPSLLLSFSPSLLLSFSPSLLPSSPPSLLPSHPFSPPPPTPNPLNPPATTFQQPRLPAKVPLVVPWTIRVSQGVGAKCRPPPNK